VGKWEQTGPRLQENRNLDPKTPIRGPHYGPLWGAFERGGGRGKGGGSSLSGKKKKVTTANRKKGKSISSIGKKIAGRVWGGRKGDRRGWAFGLKVEKRPKAKKRPVKDSDDPGKSERKTGKTPLV